MHTHSLSINSDPGRALRPWELALLLAVCVTLLTGTWAQARITAADLPEVLFGFGMCCIGALGLFTVARVAGSDGRPAIPRHAVG